ncbi:hypothetical protein GE061_003080 [Apolygus lucorum]|uniref:C2H2-type domain-containing protein n=1 Tax=Apolygus lucorum TaxID=248454 RepID=A0A8S9X2H5_APOLU|nr:hypothetical protein GE061_003080 [Apolygus lucorum]
MGKNVTKKTKKFKGAPLPAPGPSHVPDEIEGKPRNQRAKKVREELLPKEHFFVTHAQPTITGKQRKDKAVFVWQTQPINSENRKIPRKNVVHIRPGLVGQARSVLEPIDCFSLVITQETLEIIMKRTNEEIHRISKMSATANEIESLDELKTLLGLFIYGEYVCPKCSDAFRYRRYLEDHVVKCTGTNQLTHEMMRLVNRIKAIQHKIADSRKVESNLTEKVKSKVMCTGNCSVVLRRLQLPDEEKKRVFKVRIVPTVRQKDAEEIPPVEVQAVADSAVNSVVISDSSPVDTEGDSQKSSTPTNPDIEEEIDVESVVSKSQADEERRQPENPKMKSKRKKRSSSEEEVDRKRSRRGRPSTKKRPSPSVQSSTPPRKLRARKPVSCKESSADSDSEPIPELAGFSAESDVDPDFDPVKEIKKNTKRGRKAISYSDSSSEDEEGRSKGSSAGSSSGSRGRRSVAGALSCGQCNAPFANINGLRTHHRLSEKCGKLPPETVFKCDECAGIFADQSLLDKHRSEKPCRKTTPTPSNASVGKASSTTSERRPHNLATGPHICKCCKVVFNSVLGIGLHLKRSKKCIADNPSVDIPGVIDKSSVVDSSYDSTTKNSDQADKKNNQNSVFVCVKCFSSFSSVWGLRTHERNSIECKPDRPYEIPVPIPKEQAEKLKKEYLAKLKKNQTDPEQPNSSSDKGPDGHNKKQGFLMVYTQECQDEDGKFKCKTCSALFTSVWGLRTHQRMSESCGEQNKVVLSDAAAKSIAKGENICPNCAAKFSTSWGLRTHLRTSSLCSEHENETKGHDSKKKEGQILSCAKCEMIVFQLYQLRDHVKYSPSCRPDDVTITKNGRVQPGAGCFLCPQCPKTFKLPFSLEQHFVEHAPQRNVWRCHLCSNEEFADQFTMHRHFHRKHLGSWFCIICDKKPTINSFKEFYAHIFDFHSSDPENAKIYFRCPICFKSFLSKFSYDFHINSCKRLAEQIFTCASCKKVFNKKIHIHNHMKYAHTGVDIDSRYVFKCPTCPRRFLSEKEYRQKHENESCVLSEMPCEICGEMLMGFDKLKVHIEITHKKRSDLQTGRKSPLLGRKSPEPSLQSEKTFQCPSKATTVISSSSSSPVPSSLSSTVVESPASPDFSIPSVKIEPSSP